MWGNVRLGRDTSVYESPRSRLSVWSLNGQELPFRHANFLAGSGHTVARKPVRFASRGHSRCRGSGEKKSACRYPVALRWLGDTSTQRPVREETHRLAVYGLELTANGVLEKEEAIVLALSCSQAPSTASAGPDEEGPLADPQ